MVRTLSFHLKNAGSIPASLTNIKVFPCNQQSPNLYSSVFLRQANPKRKVANLVSAETNQNRIRVKHFFTSLFNPSVINSARLILNSSMSGQACSKLKKVLVKQSYMFLIWLRKVSNASGLGVIVLPQSRKSHATKLKAPMAHKTFSQEQFVFRHFKFTFTSHTLNAGSAVFRKRGQQLSVAPCLLLLLRVRSIPLKHETALFFNSKVLVNVHVCLSSYALVC